MTTYNYNINQFPDSSVNLDNLTIEITDSSIITALDDITSTDIDVDVIFKGDLSIEDKSILDDIVDNHNYTLILNYIYPIDQFPDSIVNLDNLTKEINKSSISIALNFINIINSVVNIIFKSNLSISEISTLDLIVTNHNSKSINNSVINVNVIPENIKFVEAGDVTNDMYRAESWVIDIPADTSTHAFYFYKPYNTSLLAATLDATIDMIGDSFDVTISPDTIIGGLTTNAYIGDVSINVSSTVSANLIPGRFISTNTEDYYEVIKVDNINNVITLDSPLTSNATAGGYVYMNIKLISNLYFYTAQNIEIGKSITTGQRMPAYVPVRLLYNNINGTAKKIVFFVEYLY